MKENPDYRRNRPGGTFGRMHKFVYRSESLHTWEDVGAGFAVASANVSPKRGGWVGVWLILGSKLDCFVPYSMEPQEKTSSRRNVMHRQGPKDEPSRVIRKRKKDINKRMMPGGESPQKVRMQHQIKRRGSKIHTQKKKRWRHLAPKNGVGVTPQRAQQSNHHI